MKNVGMNLLLGLASGAVGGVIAVVGTLWSVTTAGEYDFAIAEWEGGTTRSVACLEWEGWVIDRMRDGVSNDDIENLTIHAIEGTGAEGTSVCGASDKDEVAQLISEIGSALPD